MSIRGKVKAFETVPLQISEGLDAKSKSLPLKFDQTYLDRHAAFCNLIPQPGALRKPDQHAQAEPVDLSVLDLRYPSLSNAELFRRLGLRQSGLVQPFVDAGKQFRAHFKLCGFFLGEEVVEY